MSKRAIFILTDGVEELEAIAPIDILRRADVDCMVANAGDASEVTGRNHISIKTDGLLKDAMDKPWDLIVIPGGPGVGSLRKNQELVRWVQTHGMSGKLTAAICAAPTQLNDAGLLENKTYTAHASVQNELPQISPQKVVIDGAIVTSQGAGTAVEFGLALVELLCGKDKKTEVSQSIHFT